MNVRYSRLWKSAALVILICSLSSTTILATQEEIDEVQQNIDELEKQKKEAQEQAEDLFNQADHLKGDLKELNTSLSEVTAKLNQTEENLKATQKKLKKTQKSLKAARQKEKKQYQAMKKRIQFLYEMDTDSLMEILMESDGIADFLNRGEYIVSIHNYDRQMLLEFKENKEKIAAHEQALKTEQEELAALEQEEKDRKEELASLVNSTSGKLTAAKEQMESAKENAAAYEKELKRQEAYEAELEAKKAAEDAARLEEIRRQEEEMKKQKEQNKGPVSTDASDTALLAALIQCEAGGESYEGKLAVGSVVVNRVRSSHFPNTVAGVIYQSGQFSPVASGRFAAVLASGANSSCTQAASEVLGGRVTLDNLYFRRNTGAIDGTVIGNHVFY